MPQADQRADVGATSSSYSTATTSGTSSTTAVTQPAGNAAAVEAAGLATTTGQDDGILDDIVSGMLAFLPLGDALSCAWSLRTLPQVRDWLASIGMEKVVSEAPEFVNGLVDAVFPDGTTLTSGIEVGAAVAMSAGTELGYALARQGSTLSYTMRGVLELGVAGGWGVKVEGAGKTPLAEAIAELGCSGATAFEATWELPIGDTLVPETLYRCVLDLDGLDFDAMRRDIGAAVDELLALARPAALSVENSRSVAIEAGVGEGGTFEPFGVNITDLPGGHGEAEAQAGVLTGYDADGAFVELSVSASGEASGWAGFSNLLASQGCRLDEVTLKGGIAVRVRAQASTDVLKAAVATGFTDLTGISFSVGIRTTLGDASTEEVATFGTLGAVADHILGAAAAAEQDPAAVLDRWETCATDGSTGGAAIPEVSLDRSMTLTLHDPPAADALLPGWAELAADALPDHGLVMAVEAQRLEGRVHVGSDAVRALLGDPTYAVAPTEEEVVDIERILLDAAVATAPTGGLATTTWQGRDLSRVANLVHFDALGLVAEVTFAVGWDAELAEGGKLEAQAEADMTLSRRMEVTGQTHAELAEKLS